MLLTLWTDRDVIAWSRLQGEFRTQHQRQTEWRVSEDCQSLSGRGRALLYLLRMGEVHSKSLQPGRGREGSGEENVAPLGCRLMSCHDTGQSANSGLPDNACQCLRADPSGGLILTILTGLSCFLLHLGSRVPSLHIPSLLLPAPPPLHCVLIS